MLRRGNEHTPAGADWLVILWWGQMDDVVPAAQRR